MRVLAARAPTTTHLRHAAQWLLYALPVLFVTGPAPADVALILIALMFLAHSAIERDWRWLKTPWVACALVAWLYLIGAGLTVEEPATSLRRAVPFIRFIVFGAALQHWVLSEERPRRIFLIALASVVAFVTLDSLLQYAIGADIFGHPYENNRLTGPFGRPVPGVFLASVSLPLVAAGLSWAMEAHVRLRLPITVALVTILTITIALSGERMALFTFGLGLGVLLVFLPASRKPLLAAGLAALLLVSAASALNPPLATRLIGHTVADLDDFWNQRYGELFARSITVWQERPVLGFGLDHFRTACANHDFEPHGPVEDRCYTHPHQIYLEWLVGAGGVGFVLFLAIIGLWIRELAHPFRSGPVTPAAIGACAAVLILLWPLRSSMSFFVTWPALLFWLVIGLALAICRPRPLSPPS